MTGVRVMPFAGAAHGAELLREVRLELLREAQSLLFAFEVDGDAETRGRLLQALDDLKLLIRCGNPSNER